MVLPITGNIEKADTCGLLLIALLYVTKRQSLVVNVRRYLTPDRFKPEPSNSALGQLNQWMAYFL